MIVLAGSQPHHRSARLPHCPSSFLTHSHRSPHLPCLPSHQNNLHRLCSCPLSAAWCREIRHHPFRRDFAGVSSTLFMSLSSFRKGRHVVSFESTCLHHSRRPKHTIETLLAPKGMLASPRSARQNEKIFTMPSKRGRRCDSVSRAFIDHPLMITK